MVSRRHARLTYAALSCAVLLMAACGTSGEPSASPSKRLGDADAIASETPTATQPNSAPPTGQWAPLVSLPPCGESTMLTLPPLDQDDYQVILPLGLLSPPAHTIPTDHIFYVLKGEHQDEGVSPERNPPAVADVRAPGDIRVLEISITETTLNGQDAYTDFDLLFAPCRDRLFKLIHLSTLNLELTALLEQAGGSDCVEYGTAERAYRYCQATVEMDVALGTVLGTTCGQLSVAMDLTGYNLAGAPLRFANPSRYHSDLDRNLHVVCPLDWFTQEAKEEQASRFGGLDGEQRTLEPVCGEVMQDVPGTAHGSWWVEGTSNSLAAWEQQLALVRHNVDPTMAAISVGGTIMDPGVWYFRPDSSGTVNRRFADVRPDGQVHCYEGASTLRDERGPAPIFPGHLLLQLANESELLVERQDGPCNQTGGFVDPVRYQR